MEVNTMNHDLLDVYSYRNFGCGFVELTAVEQIKADSIFKDSICGD